MPGSVTYYYWDYLLLLVRPRLRRLSRKSVALDYWAAPGAFPKNCGYGWLSERIHGLSGPTPWVTLSFSNNSRTHPLIRKSENLDRCSQQWLYRDLFVIDLCQDGSSVL
jgi:hypothetical protein